ncbi:MAG: hypothetical protein JWR26_1681 [Pedosphaera sp.]|nr:hypothetical protein [Pedosphaera sp.]
MDAKQDRKFEDLMLHALMERPGHEAVLVPSMFNPPIMLSHIFRIGCAMKGKGYTTAPDRREGGWHFRLLEPGIAHCQSSAAHASR